MKKIILNLLLSFSLLGFSQNNEKEILLTDAQKMISFFNSKNYDGFLDYTYPKLFELQDRDALKNVIVATFEGSDDLKLEVLTDEMVNFVLSDLYQEDNKEFAFLTYPMKMKMIFPKAEFESSEQEMMVNMMASKGMKAHFENNNTILVSKTSLIIAIKDELTNGTWKYLNYDESPLFKMVLPENIITKATSYLENNTPKN